MRRLALTLLLMAAPIAAQGLAPVQIGKGGPAISVPMQIALSLTLLTL